MDGFCIWNKVEIESVHIERSYWGSQDCDVLKDLIEGLVSAELILIHASAPETLTSETDVPVAEIVAHELLDETAGESDVIIFVCSLHVLDQGVHQRDDPAVDLRPFSIRYCRGREVELVHVRIKREE